MIVIKIGRHEYEITLNDEFMDNGSCVQLLTQSKEPSKFGRRPLPVLSSRAIKQIYVYARIERRRSGCATIFSIEC